MGWRDFFGLGEQEDNGPPTRPHTSGPPQPPKPPKTTANAAPGGGPGEDSDDGLSLELTPSPARASTSSNWLENYTLFSRRKIYDLEEILGRHTDKEASNEQRKQQVEDIYHWLAQQEQVSTMEEAIKIGRAGQAIEAMAKENEYIRKFVMERERKITEERTKSLDYGLEM